MSSAKKQPVDSKSSKSSSLKIDNNNRAPLYHQIYLILRSKILDGEYAQGDYLPGERELEGLFQVSRITAVRALNELAAVGLVVRERGRGTRVQFVSSGIVSRGPARENEDGETIRRGTTHDVFDAIHSGGKAEVTVFEFDYLLPPPSVQAALDIPPSMPVQHATRVWRFEKKPFNYVQTYVPATIAQQWTREDLEHASLGDLMARHGIEIQLVRERVTATLADTILSKRLEVAIGSPVLKIHRIATDGDRRPVEYLVGYYPPDRYQYEVTIPRHRSGEQGA